MSKLKLIFIFAVLMLITTYQLLLVAPVFAQDCDPDGSNPNCFTIIQPSGAGFKVEPGGGSSAEGNVGRLMRNVVTILFIVGGVGVVIYFIWGAVEWIFSGGDKE